MPSCFFHNSINRTWWIATPLHTIVRDWMFHWRVKQVRDFAVLYKYGRRRLWFVERPRRGFK